MMGRGGVEARREVVMAAVEAVAAVAAVAAVVAVVWRRVCIFRRPDL
jgi:hypothetical protein